MVNIKNLLPILLVTPLLFGCFGSSNDDGPGLFDKMIDKAIEDAEKEREEEKNKDYQLDENNSITSKDLISAYNGNAIRADKTFKDKTFTVIGKIEEIGTDPLTEKPVIDLKGRGLIDFMQCHFTEAEGLEIFNIGDKVSITGTCNGKELFVEMVDCTEIQTVP